VTRNAPIENDDIRLRELFDHLTEGDAAQLTQDGRLAAVVVDRESYDQLLLAAGQDARRELKGMAAETRKRIAEAGLERELVDEAIEAVRAQRR
jgi:DICT domain-containing protein